MPEKRKVNAHLVENKRHEHRALLMSVREDLTKEKSYPLQITVIGTTAAAVKREAVAIAKKLRLEIEGKWRGLQG